MTGHQTIQKKIIPPSPPVEQPPSSSGTVVVVRTLSGFEVWSEMKPEEAERTTSGASIYRFAITSPADEFSIVRVEIPAALQDSTRRAIGPRFADDNPFWYALAEDALTEALEEQGDLPDGGHLTVERLTPSQFDMARRWND